MRMLRISLSILFTQLMTLVIVQAQWVMTSPNSGNGGYVVEGQNVSSAWGSSTDYGATWSNYPVSAYVYGASNCFAKKDSILIAGAQWGGLFRSSNRGVSWVASNTGLADFGTPSIYGAWANKSVFLVGTSNGIYYSSNNGESWTLAGASGKSIWAFTLVGQTIYAGGSWDGVYASTDNGLSWKVITPNSFGLLDIASVGQYLFSATALNGVLRSSDGGANWQSAASGLTDTYVQCLAVYRNIVFAGTGGAGIFMSTNFGSSWVAINTGLTGGWVWDLAVCGNYLVAGLGGTYRRPLSDVTSVGDSHTDQQPSDFSLAQNYPNPFNPSTTISYQLPKTSTVSLQILNPLGQEVGTLVNERKDAGSYSVQWNAASVPSGIYFYRLQAGEFVETKKMVVIK